MSDDDEMSIDDVTAAVDWAVALNDLTKALSAYERVRGVTSTDMEKRLGELLHAIDRAGMTGQKLLLLFEQDPE